MDEPNPFQFSASVNEAEAGHAAEAPLPTQKMKEEFPYAAPNDDGPGVSVDRISLTLAHLKKTGESFGTDIEGPFGPFAADNAPIWKFYMDQVKISDDNLANDVNSDLDPLLIFVSTHLTLPPPITGQESENLHNYGSEIFC